MLCMVMAMADSPDGKDKVKELYLKYHKLMRYISSKILKNPMDVDDALMSAWERVLNNLDKISDISCPETKSFLVIVIERVSIDIYRKNKSTWEKETPIENYEEFPILNM